MTIQAETTDIGAWPANGTYPVAGDWCYRCGCRHPGRGLPDCGGASLPQSLRRACLPVGLDATNALGLPVDLNDWHPAHIATAQGLVAQLQDWIGIAERLAGANR